MLIYLLFPLITLMIDYAIYREFRMRGGALMDFVFCVAGIGLLMIGLPFLPVSSITQHPAQWINSTTSNTFIPAHNTTSSMGTTTLSYALALGSLLVFIQIGYSFLMLLYAFSARKRKKYEE